MRNFAYATRDVDNADYIEVNQFKAQHTHFGIISWKAALQKTMHRNYTNIQIPVYLLKYVQWNMDLWGHIWQW